MLCMSTAIFAQEKYEQAVIRQTLMGLHISVEGKEYKRIKFEKGTTADFEDLTPILKELANMRNDGWEVWNSSVTTYNDGPNKTTYFLRRKIK